MVDLVRLWMVKLGGLVYGLGEMGLFGRVYVPDPVGFSG
jgi:hypothetical protein